MFRIIFTAIIVSCCVFVESYQLPITNPWDSYKNVRAFNMISSSIISTCSSSTSKAIATDVLKMKSTISIPLDINTKKSLSSHLKSFQMEARREIAILFHAPLQRKLVFLVHPVLAVLSIYFLSLLSPIILSTITKAWITFIAVIREFYISFKNSKNERTEESVKLKKINDQKIAENLYKNELIEKKKKKEETKKLEIIKALKIEEERLASDSEKLKLGEQKRYDIQEQTKKDEIQRTAIEQAQIRSNAQNRILLQRNLKMEEETKKRIMDVQFKRDEKNRLFEEKKFQQEEVVRLAAVAQQVTQYYKKKY